VGRPSWRTSLFSADPFFSSPSGISFGPLFIIPSGFSRNPLLSEWVHLGGLFFLVGGVVVCFFFWGFNCFSTARVPLPLILIGTRLPFFCPRIC